MTISRIPAPRVPIINLRTGEVQREWFRYFLTVDNLVVVSSDFFSTIYETSDDYSPDNDILHLMCSGSPTISLQSYANRSSVLSVTNIGTGVVTIVPISGEIIKGDTSLELDFQWTTVQLCPKTGGYVII